MKKKELYKKPLDVRFYNGGAASRPISSSHEYEWSSYGHPIHGYNYANTYNGGVPTIKNFITGVWRGDGCKCR